MPVDVNDVTKPIQSSLTAELTAELRAIKAKLKTVGTELQDVIASIGAINNMTDFGEDVIQTADAGELHELLGASAAGLQVYSATDVAAIQNLLGISSTYSGTGVTFGVFLGSLQIRWGSLTLGGNSTQVVTTFPSTCLNGQATILSDSNDGSGAPFVVPDGANLRIRNAENSARAISWLALGI